MKLVVATIRPERLACVQMALKSVKLETMNVTPTYPCSLDDGNILVHGTAGFRFQATPQLRLEVIVNEFDADEVVDAILNSGFSVRPNSKDEGRIFVVSLDVYLDTSEMACEIEPAYSR